jgi:hypothetical protein
MGFITIKYSIYSILDAYPLKKVALDIKLFVIKVVKYNSLLLLIHYNCTYCQKDCSGNVPNSHVLDTIKVHQKFEKLFKK